MEPDYINRLHLQGGFHNNISMDFALILDIVVIVILLISCIVAFLRGFVREVLTILGLGGAGLTALTVAPMLSGGLESWLSDGAGENDKFWGFVPYDIAAAVFAYAGVFVITLIIMSLISHWIAKSVHAIGLGPIDRSLGVVFGIVRGLILIGLLYMPFHLLMDDEDKESWFSESATHGYVEELADIMSALMPESMQAEEAAEEEADPLGDLTGEDDKTEPQPLPDTGTDEGAAIDAIGYDASDRQAIDDLIQNQDTKATTNE
jgi:membrane protein required for colicin V production